MTDFLDIFVLIFKIYCYISISLLPITIYYSLFESKYKPNSKFYPKKKWYHFLKVLWAESAVRKYKNKFDKIIKNGSKEVMEKPRQITTFMRSDYQTIFGSDQKGNTIFLKINLRENRLAEVCLQLRLADGTIYQLPEHPLILLCSIPEREWKAGGIKIEIIKPFETLRIIYNGLLRSELRNDELYETGTVKHVYFNFIWSAAAEAKYFPQDSNTNFLAKAVAMEPWRDAKWINYLGYQTGFTQYGMLIGEIRLPNSQIYIRLTTSRVRCWGPSENRVMHRGLTLFANDKHGFAFTIHVKSYTKGCKELHIGDVILPNKSVCAIEDCDISLPDFFEDRIIPGAFEFSFKAAGQNFDCRAFTYLESIADMRNEEEKGYKMKLIKIKYTVNTEDATGFALFWYKHEGRGMQTPAFIVRAGKQIVEPERIFVASLNSVECRSEYLAGCKGTALSLLTTVPINKFKMANGFCVLAPALNQYLEINRNIKTELMKLNDICSGRRDEDISEICQNIQYLFQTQPLSYYLMELISNELELLKLTTFDEECEENSQFWAVRSSYINTDINLEPILKSQSYLDCTTEDEIFQVIKLCWASTYSYENVQHRRKKCLPIIIEMAVVIQQLINSKSAGILYTNEPTTNNPAKIVINSNYGLGMSITTNIAEADKIILNRSWNNVLIITSKSIGTKLYKNIITQNGLIKTENDKNDSSKLSLNDKQVLELSEISVKLEKILGGPKIVEWALHNENIYILNTKPIRTQYEWTEFNILHENDTAILSDNDYILLQNSKYVFQKPTLILNQSVMAECLNDSLQEVHSSKSTRNSFFTKINHCIGTNIFQTVLKYVDTEKTQYMKINELICNEQLFITKKILDEALSRNKSKNLFDNLKYFYNSITCCLNAKDFAKEAYILSQAMKIKLCDNCDANIHFKIIRRNFYILKRIFYLNECVMLSNEFYQKLLLNVLYDKAEDLSRNEYKNVMSKFVRTTLSEIPNILEEIASCIKNQNLQDEFHAIDVADGEKWFEMNCKEALKLYKKIIRIFGHYSLQEMNLKSETWNMHTNILIKILQMIVAENNNDKSKQLPEKEINSVTSRHMDVKTKGRFVKWMEERLCNSFEYLDITKLAIAVAINKLRTAIKVFSEKLVLESKIPTRNLIYYLSCTEIEKLLKNKNPEVIIKAMKRVEYFEKWKSLDMPDLYSGNILNFTPKQILDDVKIYGRTVTSGYVQGQICVVNNIKELNNLKSGDILVTKYLETGFIPCFPILSGIIAEYGSFLCQAAVVTRQLHIPCIVNIKNATQLFKTGDTVKLNGKTETVEKIPTQH